MLSLSGMWQLLPQLYAYTQSGAGSGPARQDAGARRFSAVLRRTRRSQSLRGATAGPPVWQFWKNWLLANIPLFASACVEIENYARRHIAVLEAVEDLVDCGQRLQLDIGFDLTSDGEGQRFGHILARSDE